MIFQDSLCVLMSENLGEAPPAVVTSLGYPKLAVTVETMGGHVVGHPPRDLHTHTKTFVSEQCAVMGHASG